MTIWVVWRQKKRENRTFYRMQNRGNWVPNNHSRFCPNPHPTPKVVGQVTLKGPTVYNKQRISAVLPLHLFW